MAAAGEDKEAAFQSRIDILNETNATRIAEKEAEISRLQVNWRIISYVIKMLLARFVRKIIFHNYFFW